MTTAEVCEVCGHAQSSHDKIAQRFCQATSAHTVDRACVCPVPASTGEAATGDAETPSRQSEAPMYGRGRFSKT